MASNRVTITLTEETQNKVDNACNRLGVTRSSFIAMAINEKINNDDAFRMMPDVIKAMQTLKEQSDQMNLEQVRQALQMVDDKK